MSATPRQVLVIGPSWVGDMVMAQSLFITLKQQDVVRLGVVAPVWSKDLLARIPQVDTVYTMPVAHGRLGLGARWQLAKLLRAARYDQAIVLPGSFKSALVPFLAGIPQRTGWLGEQRYGLLNDWRRLDKPKSCKIVARYVALAFPGGEGGVGELSELPQPRLISSGDAQRAVRARLGLKPDLPVLALCPGAEFGNSKQWPAAYYGELAAQKIRDGWQVWVLGSEKDQPVAESVQAAAARILNEADLQLRCQVVAGKTSLIEAVDLLAQADAVVSNDSGLMHIAAATGRKLVAIYGATPHEGAPPLSHTAEVVYHEGLSCRPCFKRVCPLKHHDCMRGISVKQVSSALQRLGVDK